MKTLFLLRHAKSCWDDPDLKDFERPLADRGLADVPVMLERFKSRAGTNENANEGANESANKRPVEKLIDCIICSPAVRTKTTAQLFAEQIGYPQDEIGSNPELYFAGSNMFLKAASLVDEINESAMLVGHNPAITEFANALTGESIDNIPTCGLVEVQLPIDNWSEIELGQGTLVEFDYPKKQQS